MVLCKTKAKTSVWINNACYEPECIGVTLTKIVVIPLCYGESSLRITSWYVFPPFLYGPSNSHL